MIIAVTTLRGTQSLKISQLGQFSLFRKYFVNISALCNIKLGVKNYEKFLLKWDTEENRHPMKDT